MLVLMHVKLWKATLKVETRDINQCQILKPIYSGRLENSHHGIGESLDSMNKVLQTLMNVSVQNIMHVTIIKCMSSSLLHLLPEWQRSCGHLLAESRAEDCILSQSFMTILKHIQNEVIEIRTKNYLAHTVITLALLETCYGTKDDEMTKEKEIDKLMALISLSFKKIYKPTNNNLRTSSNTSRANQDNSPRLNRSTGYDIRGTVMLRG
ncbi:hypothetical protein Tco_0481927 [Tanacetum coccineum]